MKFWKLSILTLLAFVSAVILVVHTSCERNVCDNVTCFNGGACNGAGTCTCPVGYEGPQCAIVSRSYFIGNYAGINQCVDNGVAGGYLADSVQITAASNVDFVNVAILNNGEVTNLTGYVSDNASTYSIIVAADSTSTYIQRYTITLQGNTNLTINSYTWQLTPEGHGVMDTAIANCYFKGSKLP